MFWFHGNSGRAELFSQSAQQRKLASIHCRYNCRFLRDSCGNIVVDTPAQLAYTRANLPCVSGARLLEWLRRTTVRPASPALSFKLSTIASAACAVSLPGEAPTPDPHLTLRCSEGHVFAPPSFHIFTGRLSLARDKLLRPKGMEVHEHAK